MDLHCLGTPGVTVTELLGIHSRGTRGFTQSRNAWICTVENRADLHSRRNAWIYNLRTRGFTHSRNAWIYNSRENAWVYTVAERGGFSQSWERVGLDSRGTPGVLDSRGNAWVYTVAERVGLDCRGTRGFRESRDAWL